MYMEIVEIGVKIDWILEEQEEIEEAIIILPSLISGKMNPSKKDVHFWSMWIVIENEG